MISRNSLLRKSARSLPYVGVGIALALGGTVFATTVGTNISTDGSLTVSGGATTLRGVAYTWPAADGTSGQFIATDGSGVLSWTTASPSSGGGWTDDGAAVRLTTAADQVSIGNATPISPAVLSVRATTSAATAGIFRAAATPQVTIFQIQDSAAGNIFSVTATSSMLLSQGLIHVATTTGTSTIVSNLQVGSTLLLGSGGYLTGTRLNFTAASTIGTDSGALTVAPIAGSSVNVNLSTTGDFVVTTNDLVVDTSADRVGIQTATPNTTFEVVGTASTTNLLADLASFGNASAIAPAILTVRASSTAATTGIFRAAATPQVTIFQIQDSAAGNIFSVTSTSSLLLSQGLIHVATTTGTSTMVSNLNVGSTLSLGGTSYLTGTRLNFTGASTIGTDSGALTVAPIAGSGVNVNLSTTGDFVVTTNDLVVDTSADRVGIQTATPNTTFEVVGTASTTNLIVGGNGTSLAGLVAGYCTIPATTVTASSTNYANCTGATGVLSGDRVIVQATSSLADNFIIQSASSTAAATINVKILNTGMIAGTATGINSFNFWAFR